MQVVEEGAIVLEWYPEERLLCVWSRSTTGMSGAAARALIAKLAPLAGAGPIDALIDGRQISDVSLMWRLEWAEFFFRRPGSRFAIYDLAPGLRVVLSSFASLARIEGRTVPDQETGLAWLQAARTPPPLAH